MTTPKDLQTRYDDLSVKFDEKYAEVEDLIDVNDVQLREALGAQTLLERNWLHFKARVSRLANEAEYYRDERLGAAHKHFMHSQRAYSSTEVKRLAENDSEYLEYKMIHIQTLELKEMVDGVVDIIHSRRYVLNNITNAMVAAVDKQVI